MSSPMRQPQHTAMSNQSIGLRQRAFEIIRDKSLRKGHVVLSSGGESNYYFDMKMTMLDPEGAQVLARLIYDELRDLNVERVGGLELGAIPLIAPLAIESLLQGRPMAGFIVRKASKDHGTRKEIEGEPIKGKKVVVIEDVTTQGKSALYAVEEARHAGANVQLVLSVVDRNEGARELFKSKGIPFKFLFEAQSFLEP
jgi:orotate phosphoribosyltransferase